MEVQVEYDYTAEERDELTLKQGDIVTNVSQFEEGWYIGTFNGKEGVFPDNFVRIIKPAPGKSNSTKVASQQECQTGRASSRQVISSSSLNVGDDGGEKIAVQSKPHTSAATASPPTNSAAASNKSLDYVKVVYGYTPEQSDELELVVDDFIQVLSRDLPEEGWWRGINLRSNKLGVFPDNFVKVADPNDPSFKRAIADYKMRTGSSTQRAHNSTNSSAHSRPLPNSAAASSGGGSKRLDLNASKSEVKRRGDSAEGGPGDHGRLSSKRLPDKLTSNVGSSSVPRTDAKATGKSEAPRSGRNEPATQKGNAAFSALGRKNSITKPDHEIVTSKSSTIKTRFSSLTRLDQNRSSDATPRNLGNLQSIVSEQQERLKAVANQLDDFAQVVETLRREQREHADDVNSKLTEFSKQLKSMRAVQGHLANTQKMLTDRIQTLMSDVDVVRKSRLEDMVVLDRLKKVVYDIDSWTMNSGLLTNGAGEEYRGHMEELADINQNSTDIFASSKSNGYTKPPTGPR
uniref:SH3 domain-containing kinase-binding protein 1 n=1 Tax=Mesocestoides corti TaxID=53468 RepID=A0A5K3EQK9_MESCO